MEVFESVHNSVILCFRDWQP